MTSSKTWILILLSQVIVSQVRSVPLYPLHSNEVGPPDPACSSAETQEISFHLHKNYSGLHQTFCSNQANLQAIPGHHQKAKIFCIERGVWVIQFTQNGIPNQEGILGSGNLGRICLTYPDNMDVQFTAIRYLASSDMTTSALSLYKDRFKGGELRLEGSQVRLPQPIESSSFALTGEFPYTIYSGIDFDGDSECLRPGKNDPVLKGVSFHPELTVRTVGSVKQGCDEIVTKVEHELISLEISPNLMSNLKIEKF